MSELAKFLRKGIRLTLRSAIFREAQERIYDQDTIDAQLDTLTDPQRSVLWKLYRGARGRATAAEAANRAELIKLFKQATGEIEGDVYQVFGALGSDTWDLASVRRIGRDQALVDQINDRIRALGGQVDGQLGDDLLAGFKAQVADSAHMMDALTPESVNLTFGLLPDTQIAAMLSEPWAGARYSDRLGLITSQMQADIKHALLRSMMSGDSWQDAARSIRGLMGTAGTGAVWRAEMIARTELRHAQELANEEFAAQNADVIADTVWVASPAACDECKAKHGRSVDEVGRPPEDSHPNCDCGTMNVPKAWGALAREGDDDFSIHPQSRQDWAAANMPDAVGGDE